jgi:hypothetical protein
MCRVARERLRAAGAKKDMIAVFAASYDFASQK